MNGSLTGLDTGSMQDRRGSTPRFARTSGVQLSSHRRSGSALYNFDLEPCAIDTGFVLPADSRATLLHQICVSFHAAASHL